MWLESGGTERKQDKAGEGGQPRAGRALRTSVVIHRNKSWKATTGFDVPLLHEETRL